MQVAVLGGKEEGREERWEGEEESRRNKEVEGWEGRALLVLVFSFALLLTNTQTHAHTHTAFPLLTQLPPSALCRFHHRTT